MAVADPGDAFTWQLTLIGRLFENKANPLLMENLRLAMLAICGYYWYQLDIITLGTLSLLLMGAVLSLGCAVLTLRFKCGKPAGLPIGQ